MVRLLRVVLFGLLAVGTYGCGDENCHGDDGDTGCDATGGAGSGGGAGAGAGGGQGGDGGVSSPAEAYCFCVFDRCHEPYHDKWGEDEMVSRDSCLAEAEALSQGGATGNTLGCRQAQCELAAADATVCAAALGDEVCVDADE